MKKFILSIFILFLFANTVGQNVNYIPYYHLVNRAKFVKCVNADCDSAIVYYLQAFEMVDYILREDLQNFTQCTAMLEKDSLVYYAMDRCIAQTVYLSAIFTSNSLFDKYKNTEKWNECYAIEQENIEKYKEKYAIGDIYRKVLDSLVVSDREVRIKWFRFHRFFPNTKEARKLRERWHVVDSCNRLVLDEMIEKYDFPNERNGSFNNPQFIYGGVVFIHYDDTNFLRNVEYKALIAGKLSPDYYAKRANRLACAFNWNRNENRFCYYNRFNKKMTSEEKEQVDKNRYEIGLPSVEEENIIKQCNYVERKALEKKRKK